MASRDGWLQNEVYLPESASVEQRSNRTFTVALDRRLCRLRTGGTFAIAPRPHLRDALPLQQLTASKLHTWWAVEAMRQLRCSSRPRLPRLQALDGWVFLPSIPGCDRPESWRPSEIVDARRCHDLVLQPAAAGASPTLSLPRSRDGTSGETLLLGRLTQHALASVGPCAAAARDSLLDGAATFGTRRAGAPVIGMLVRRGDACERWEGEALPLRPCWPLANYLRAARRLRERRVGPTALGPRAIAGPRPVAPWLCGRPVPTQVRCHACPPRH
mmetsp:Transcript_42185/g.133196  ORF Transcript_42185/g.133196 Transcript_42185/m.133196 type:complete len:273 (-) Transcript_42185:509-1327(-)